MIEIKNLTKKYGQKYAINDVSFTVKEGEILGFLGPNGAGKTTTMNILTGYISSTGGIAKIDGYDILEEPMKAKSKIGYLPESPPVYNDMKVLEYLQFVFELKKVKGFNRDEHIRDILDMVKITDVKDRLIKNLSKGYKQRVGLAQALIGLPKVLILDEPTVGLDPQQILDIRKLISDLREKHTIILSSHILTEISAVCDRVIIINKGRIVAEDTPENLANTMSDGGFRIAACIEGEKNLIENTVKTIDGVTEIEFQNSSEPGSFDILITSDPSIDIRKNLNKALVANNLNLLMLNKVSSSLEETFINLISDDPKIQEHIDVNAVASLEQQNKESAVSSENNESGAEGGLE